MVWQPTVTVTVLEVEGRQVAVPLKCAVEWTRAEDGTAGATWNPVTGSASWNGVNSTTRCTSRAPSSTTGPEPRSFA
jgi:hypothetical protein